MGLRDIRPYFVIGTVILLSMPDWTDTAKVLHELPTPPRPPRKVRSTVCILPPLDARFLDLRARIEADRDAFSAILRSWHRNLISAVSAG